MNKSVEQIAAEWLLNAEPGQELRIGWQRGEPVTVQDCSEGDELANEQPSTELIRQLFSQFRDYKFYGSTTVVKDDIGFHLQIRNSLNPKAFK